MAKEIRANYPTGNTLYALVYNTVGQVWNPTLGTPAFVALGTAITQYAIALSESSLLSEYTADMPSVPSGVYPVEVRKRVGGSAAMSDPVVGGGEINWSGTAVIVPFNSANYSAPPSALAIATQTDTTLSGTHGDGSWSSGGTVIVYGDAGSIAYTFTVYDVDSVTPLAGVAVRVSANNDGMNQSPPKISDSLGRVTFLLDPGVVYFFCSFPGRTFAPFYQETV